MPVDATVVRRRLRQFERCLRVLRALGRGAFESDEAVQDRVERNAELAAQACADIAVHIVSALGQDAPEAYADAIVALATAGVVPSDLGARIAGVVRLRNILVHDYLDVDHGRLFDELSWVDDAAAFGGQSNAGSRHRDDRNRSTVARGRSTRIHQALRETQCAVWRRTRRSVASEAWST